MSRKDKILAKVLASNGKNISYEDFIRALKAAGFSKVRQDGTSHGIWKTIEGEFMNIQASKNQAKPYQIEQFKTIMNRQKGDKK